MSTASAPASEAPAAPQASSSPSHPDRVDCIIAGGGPAGVFLALLLVRQGISVALLEAHGDFDREFRGDTIHPATMEVLDEIGLAEKVLALKPGKMTAMRLRSGTEEVTAANFSLLKTKFPYIAVLSQALLLNLLAKEAAGYEGFHLLYNASVNGLLKQDGIVNGVTFKQGGVDKEMRAQVVIGADGRASRVRRLAELELVKTAAPMDVLWFRVPQPTSVKDEEASVRFGPGRMLVSLDRGDHLQIGVAVPKKGYSDIRQLGIEAFIESVTAIFPELKETIGVIKSWKDIALLTVECGRLTTWHRPGVLCIGDAAHIMSPVGGVGIAYAVQDAVAAANILTEPLRDGKVTEIALLAVQARRERPTRFIQNMQVVLHDQIVSAALRNSHDLPIPMFARIIPRIPILRKLPAKILGYGIRPEHVKYPHTRGPVAAGRH